MEHCVDYGQLHPQYQEKYTKERYEKEYTPFDKSKIVTFLHEVDNECQFIEVLDKGQAMAYISVLEGMIADLNNELAKRQ